MQGETMNRTSIFRRAAAALCALALVAWAPALDGFGQYSASGFAVKASTLLGSLGAVPASSVTEGQHLSGTSRPNVGLPGVVSTGLLSAISTGASSPDVVGAQTTSTLADLSVLNGLISADQLVAAATSTLSDGVARSDAEGSSIAGLRVGGTTFGSQMPAPNTRVNLPGVGYALINEQVRSGDGVTRSGITVNLVRVVLQSGLTGIKTGEIILGSATSSVSR
jgi:hypothetical protein